MTDSIKNPSPFYDCDTSMRIDGTLFSEPMITPRGNNDALWRVDWPLIFLEGNTSRSLFEGREDLGRAQVPEEDMDPSFLDTLTPMSEMETLHLWHVQSQQGNELESVIGQSASHSNNEDNKYSKTLASEHVFRDGSYNRQDDSTATRFVLDRAYDGRVSVSGSTTRHAKHREIRSRDVALRVDGIKEERPLHAAGDGGRRMNEVAETERAAKDPVVECKSNMRRDKSTRVPVTANSSGKKFGKNGAKFKPPARQIIRWTAALADSSEKNGRKKLRHLSIDDLWSIWKQEKIELGKWSEKYDKDFERESRISPDCGPSQPESLKSTGLEQPDDRTNKPEELVRSGNYSPPRVAGAINGRITVKKSRAIQGRFTDDAIGEALASESTFYISQHERSPEGEIVPLSDDVGDLAVPNAPWHEPADIFDAANVGPDHFRRLVVPESRASSRNRVSVDVASLIDRAGEENSFHHSRCPPTLLDGYFSSVMRPKFIHSNFPQGFDENLMSAPYEVCQQPLDA